MEESPPLPTDVVLDAREVARIGAATKAFNKFIAKKAKEHGAALFDVHGFLNQIDAEGIVVVAPTLASLVQNIGLAPLIGKPLAIVGDARIGARADQAVITERLLSISGEDFMTIDRKFALRGPASFQPGS